VEGEASGVSWKDIYSFFTHFELGNVAGGDDGFVILPASPGNRQRLKAIAG
jgi:hypothetical protein